MTVTLLETRHIRDAVRLEKECFAEPWSEKAFADSLSRNDTLFLAALEENAFLGYIGFYLTPDCADVTNVAVFPAYRRRGVANALFENAFLLLHEKGIVTVNLEVRPSNNAAVALYTSLGFTPAGIRKHFYRFPAEDALLYQKIIKKDIP